MFVLVSEYLATQQAYTTICRAIATSNASNTLPIVIACCNSSSNVGTMSAIIGFYRPTDDVFCRNKVISVNIINKTIAIIINVRLTILLLLVDIKVVYQVFVRDVNTTIDNSHNDILLTGRVLFPNRFDVTVCTLYSTSVNRTIVIIMPLFAKKWVVKFASYSLHACIRRAIRSNLDLRSCHWQHTFSTFNALCFIELSQHGSHIFRLIKVDGVPSVESCRYRSGFIFASRLKDSFHLIST